MSFKFKSLMIINKTSVIDNQKVREIKKEDVNLKIVTIFESSKLNSVLFVFIKLNSMLKGKINQYLMNTET